MIRILEFRREELIYDSTFVYNLDHHIIKTNIMAVYSCDILCRERLTKYKHEINHDSLMIAHQIGACLVIVNEPQTT